MPGGRHCQILPSIAKYCQASPYKWQPRRRLLSLNKLSHSADGFCPRVFPISLGVTHVPSPYICAGWNFLFWIEFGGEGPWSYQSKGVKRIKSTIFRCSQEVNLLFPITPCLRCSIAQSTADSPHGFTSQNVMAWLPSGYGLKSMKFKVEHLALKSIEIQCRTDMD